MASLTSELESPTRGSGPVDPGPGTGGSPFMTGLAKLATGYIGGMASRDAAAKDDARVAAADARAADTRKATNAVYGASFDCRRLVASSTQITRSGRFSPRARPSRTSQVIRSSGERGWRL